MHNFCSPRLHLHRGGHMTIAKKTERYMLNADDEGFCVVRVSDPSVVIVRGHPDFLLKWVDDANRSQKTKPSKEPPEESQEGQEEELRKKPWEDEYYSDRNQLSINDFA